MERTLNVMTLDIKKKGFLSNLIIYLFVAVCISVLLCIHGKMTNVPEIFLSLTPYIILVISSFSLTQEFTNKTDKMIFTGIFTRNEIMASKLISFIFMSIICFMFYEAASLACNTFDSKMLFHEFCLFVIYAFTLGSFILLISVITSSFLVTGIIGYVLYFDLILVLLNQALSSGRSKALKCVIRNLPFYIANTGFFAGKYTLHQSVIMLTSGTIFFTIACAIINIKNM